MSKNPLKRTILKGFLSAFLTLTILTAAYGPTSPTTHKTEAFAAIVNDPIQTVFSSISSVWDFVTGNSIIALEIKEYILDAITWGLVNEMLHQMSQSIIRWINSGFHGSPAFVLDLNGYLKDVADGAFDKFINDVGWGFLCSPFKLEVQAALKFKYNEEFKEEVKCTIDDVATNIENFFNGDMYAGGWDSWFEVSAKPQNNPYGALLIAERRAGIRIVNEQNQEATLLDFGKGFFSMKDANGNITTPGNVIQDQLNETLDTDRQRLLVADEINEIIAALVSQLARQALGGVGGLLGLTSSGNQYSSSGGSYFDAIEEAGGASVPFEGHFSLIENAVEAEETNIDEQQDIVDLIDDAEDYALSCGETLPASLSRERDDAFDSIQESEATIAEINSQLGTIDSTTDPQAIIGLMDELLDSVDISILGPTAGISPFRDSELDRVRDDVDEFVDSVCEEET